MYASWVTEINLHQLVDDHLTAESVILAPVHEVITNEPGKPLAFTVMLGEHVVTVTADDRYQRVADGLAPGVAISVDPRAQDASGLFGTVRLVKPGARARS